MALILVQADCIYFWFDSTIHTKSLLTATGSVSASASATGRASVVTSTATTTLSALKYNIRIYDGIFATFVSYFDTV